jgi:nucleoside-diphosphate-sugar epimerase
MHTILGSGGAIGNDLALSLYNKGKAVRLVSRNPAVVNPTDELVSVDLVSGHNLDQAVKGSEVCYLTVGLPYTTAYWEKHWAPMITRVVEACIRHGVRLVFFDNVYGLGEDAVGNITESAPLKPSSRKGTVRAACDRLVLDQVEKGKLNAIVARAPDFFGVRGGTSAAMLMIYENLLKGKASQWLCNADVPHSFGYVPNLAEGTALLGCSNDAWNKVWNLPVDTNAPTARQWVQMFAEAMGKEDTRVQVLPKWGMRMMGLFVKPVAEMVEMAYQFDRPYHFNSSAFCKHFAFSPTDNRKAVQTVVQELNGRSSV